MEYVLDENGSIKAGADGQPLVKDGEKEFQIDAIGASARIEALSGESGDWRKKYQAIKPIADKLGDHKVDDLLDSHTRAATMSDDHKTALDDYKTETETAWNDKLSVKDEEITLLKNNLSTHLIDDKIRASGVIPKTVLPEHIFMQHYRKNFKLEAGKPVAYDGDKMIYSKSKPGEPAEIDEALTHMIDSDPKKDEIWKGAEMQGGGSPPGHHNRGLHGASQDKRSGADVIRGALEKRGGLQKT